MHKKLSIIIPIYNAEKYLNNLIDSVINQINDNIEMILIDDGSTDNSPIICREYEKKYSNIIVKSFENSGSGEARNRGIEIAKGEYLFFPDSDDLVCENAINSILESLNDNPDYVVYSYYQKYRDNDLCELIKLEDCELDGNALRRDYTQCLIPSSKIYLQGAPWNKVFKRSIIKDNNIKFPKLKRHQDDVFIISYINSVNKIKIVSKPIYIYYQNLSFDESLKFPTDYFEIRKKVYEIFTDNLYKWNSTQISKDYVAFSFLLCLKRIFMLTYSEKWHMTSEERDKYFDRILYDDVIKKISCVNKKTYNCVIEIIPKLSLKKKLLYKFYLQQVRKRRKRILKLISFILYKSGNNSIMLKIKK